MYSSGSERHRCGRSNSRSSESGSSPAFRATSPKLDKLALRVHVAPNGRTFLWLTHGHGNADTRRAPISRESHDGHITVTPLIADLTAHDLIAPLAQALG